MLEPEPFDVDLLIAAPGWMKDALCSEPRYAAVEFFPDRGGGTKIARAICYRCLVREECLEFAMTEHLRHGIFGGTTPGQRRKAELDAEVAAGILYKTA